MSSYPGRTRRRVEIRLKTVLNKVITMMVIRPLDDRRGRTVVNALHKWLISIFRKTSEANNSQVRSVVVPRSLYIVTGYEVIVNFRSATNSVNATSATATLTVRKYVFSIIDYLRKNISAGNCKIYHHVKALTSQPKTMSPATSGRQQIEESRHNHFCRLGWICCDPTPMPPSDSK